MAIDADASECELLLTADDACEVVYDTYVVVTNHVERDAVSRRALAAPSCLYDAVAEALAQFGGVGAVAAVDLDASAGGDESKHLVALDGLAAFCQLEVDALEVLVYHEHVVALVVYIFVGIAL